MIDRKAFFVGIRQQPFDGKLSADQVAGTSAVLDEWERRKLMDLRWLSYILATTKWETASTMQPITERGSQTYLRSKSYYPWIGRGYVQLTWQRNYLKMTQLLHNAGFKETNLIASPERALEPDVAAFIMFEGMLGGVFTGKKLSDYFNAGKTDWLNARRIINGVDKAPTIAGIAKMFFTDLSNSNA